MADRVDQAGDAPEAMQTASRQVSDMGDAAEGHEMMGTDTMNGDAANHDHVGAAVLEALAESLGRIDLVTAEQPLLPKLADALRCLARMHRVTGDAAGGEQIRDRTLEGGRVERTPARNADAEGRARGWGVIAHECQGLRESRNDTRRRFGTLRAMALKSTIFKANLNVADVDRGYYNEHALTLARHPSETDERMMVRLLAFALYADERLEFGKGLSTTDEPALWLKELHGDVRLWIEVGLPDERTLRKASGRAAEVIVFAYGGRAVDVWWAKEGAAITRLPNVRVLAIASEESEALAALAERSMTIQCTIQDGQAWWHAGEQTVSINPRVLT